MSGLTYFDYNQKSFAVKGDPAKYDELLKQLGARRHSKMKDGGSGWLLPKDKEQALKTLIKELEHPPTSTTNNSDSNTNNNNNTDNASNSDSDESNEDNTSNSDSDSDESNEDNTSKSDSEDNSDSDKNDDVISASDSDKNNSNAEDDISDEDDRHNGDSDSEEDDRHKYDRSDSDEDDRHKYDRSDSDEDDRHKYDSEEDDRHRSDSEDDDKRTSAKHKNERKTGKQSALADLSEIKTYAISSTYESDSSDDLNYRKDYHPQRPLREKDRIRHKKTYNHSDDEEERKYQQALMREQKRQDERERTINKHRRADTNINQYHTDRTHKKHYNDRELDEFIVSQLRKMDRNKRQDVLKAVKRDKAEIRRDPEGYFARKFPTSSNKNYRQRDFREMYTSPVTKKWESSESDSSDESDDYPKPSTPRRTDTHHRRVSRRNYRR